MNCSSKKQSFPHPPFLLPPQPALTVLSPLADLFPHELFPRTLVLVLGAVSPFVFTVIVQGGSPSNAAAVVLSEDLVI